MDYYATGKVITVKEGSFEWNIDDFLGRSLRSELRSPSLTFSGADYKIEIEKSHEDDMIRLLFFQPRRLSQRIHVTIGMRTGPRGRMERRSCIVQEGRDTTDLGVWAHFSEFTSRRCEILKGGRLTVSCVLRIVEAETQPEADPSKEEREADSDGTEREVTKDSETESDEEEDSNYETLKKLQKDMKNLFKSGKDCDVTLKVQTKEFPAHKIVLRTRSPVFDSMFSHDLEENRTGVVDIEDCDPGTFPDFLKYLYSGSTKHISEENVCQLYAVADKYQAVELKRKCADFMMTHLSVETFCDFIALALKYTEKELVHLATRFFCDNAKEIVKSAKWQIFLKDNSTIGNELFLKALSG